MVIITSTPALATPAGESAALAPASTRAATACGNGSKTVRLWPALSRLRAIGPPMLPRPRKPICMMTTFSFASGGGAAAHRPVMSGIAPFNSGRPTLGAGRQGSFQGDGGVHCAAGVVLVEPALCDRLG